MIVPDKTVKGENMNRKSKLFFSFISLCFSLAVLCFGGCSITQTSYAVSGDLNYVINGASVSWTTRVYRMTSTVPLGATSTVAEENQANVNAIQALGAGDSVGSGYEQITGSGYEHNGEIYNNTVPSPGTKYNSKFEVPPLAYDSPSFEPSKENQGYAFYIVIDITNHDSEVANAAVLMNNEIITSRNTDYRYTNEINIPAAVDGTYGAGRLVIGLALEDITERERGNFSFTISINKESTTFGNDNVLFSTATTAVVESVNVDGASTTYATPVTFANAEAISLNSETIGAKEEKTVKITLKAQNSNSAYQRLKLTYSNLPEGLRVNSTSIFLPQDGTEKVYTIKFYNQTSEEISLENVQATISLENVSNLLMHDEANNYYYVEMGTIMRDTENEYIRWRYISADGETPIGDATVSSLNGTYILETDLISEYMAPLSEIIESDQPTAEDLVTIDNYLANNYTGTVCGYQSSISFMDLASSTAINTEYNTNANDYKTSTIRRYMNYTGDNKVVKHASFQDSSPFLEAGEFPEDTIILNIDSNKSSQATNMVTDLNIDIDQDIIYNEIFARSLTNDLYADIGASNSNATTGTPIEVPSVNVEGLSDTNSDKFWLLSVAEANTLFTSDGERDWNESEQMDAYWYRSPDSSGTLNAYGVDYVGYIGGFNVIGFNAARPAFQIS